MDLKQHLLRQIAFSRETFGPDERTNGVIDHIKKELKEIAAEPTSIERAREWVDVAILALDGLWRALATDPSTGKLHPDLDDEAVAYTACFMIEAKQSKNEHRDWPDWRTAEPGKAIEHVRGDE